MLIVTGSVTATADTFDTLLAASRAHVRRSRDEDGCLEHGVAIDAGDPHRLIFFERWRDRAALDAHFHVPASVAFVATVRRQAAAHEGPTVYEVVA